MEIEESKGPSRASRGEWIRLGNKAKDSDYSLEKQALEAEQPGPTISYDLLLSSPVDGIFVNTIKTQDLQASKEYLAGIEALLNSKPDKSLAVGEYRQLLLLFDSKKSPEYIQEYLERGFFGLPVGGDAAPGSKKTLRSTDTLPKEDFLKVSNYFGAYLI